MENADYAKSYETHGFVRIDQLLGPQDIAELRQLYEDFLEGRIETGHHRSDLSGLSDGDATTQQRIVQIMRPSVLYPALAEMPVYAQVRQWAQLLQGEDMELDFDMLIDKPPFTDTPTPWHQDEAYWIDMPDKRSASCWIALDEVDAHNGCMWFVPGSNHTALRPHLQTGKGGALACEGSESEGIPVEMPAGSCTFHHGRTLHYSRGNSTGRRRRALILNFRPAAMIAFERERGFDHIGEREVRTN